MIYSGECSMCTWKECLFCCFRMECSECICEIHLLQCVIQSHCFLVDFLLRWSVHCCKWVVKFPYYCCVIINEFLYICYCFIYLDAPKLRAWIFTIARSSWICWNCFCGLICDLFWRMFHVHLKKNVYSVGLGWNVLNLSVKSIWSNVPFKALFPCWFSVWMIYLMM